MIFRRPSFDVDVDFELRVHANLRRKKRDCSAGCLLKKILLFGQGEPETLSRPLASGGKALKKKSSKESKGKKKSKGKHSSSKPCQKRA